mmetsp:Transcript_118841/g.341207  ORF Transcript_118841/g.341207 Transcript_118841/m.341207 type:complete len:245 (+) Transcript_118841:679-1413(+)
MLLVAVATMKHTKAFADLLENSRQLRGSSSPHPISHYLCERTAWSAVHGQQVLPSISGVAMQPQDLEGESHRQIIRNVRMFSRERLQRLALRGLHGDGPRSWDKLQHEVGPAALHEPNASVEAARHSALRLHGDGLCHAECAKHLLSSAMPERVAWSDADGYVLDINGADATNGCDNRGRRTMTRARARCGFEELPRRYQRCCAPDRLRRHARTADRGRHLTQGRRPWLRRTASPCAGRGRRHG